MRGTFTALSALCAGLGLFACEGSSDPPNGGPDTCPGRVSTPLSGQLDPSFGEAGIARVSFGGDDDGSYFDLDVVDDRIIAAGWGAGGLGAIRFRLARLTDAGALDPTFGEDGRVTTGWAQSTADAVYANAVGRQQGGRIVAMGWRDQFRGASANVAMAGYLADGSLDRDFGDGGRSLLDLGGEERILDGLVLPDDRIVVVGQRDDHLVVARATADGLLDRDFGDGGHRLVGIGRSSEAGGVVVDPLGRIVVAGSANIGGQHDMVLVRFTAGGDIDQSFGEGGIVVAGDPLLDERAVAIGLSPDGSLVVAGDAAPLGGDRDFQVRMFLPDGSPALGFGEGGVATPAITGGDDQAEDMVVLPGGDVLVVGNSGEWGAWQPLAARYTCRGELDPTFGEDGVVELDLGEYGVVRTVRRYSEDQVLLGGGDVGMSPGPGTYGVVARMWM